MKQKRKEALPMKYKPVKIGVIGCGMISDTYMHNLRDIF